MTGRGIELLVEIRSLVSPDSDMSLLDRVSVKQEDPDTNKSHSLSLNKPAFLWGLMERQSFKRDLKKKRGPAGAAQSLSIYL